MMNRFGVALLALPLLAVAARADDPFAPGLPFRVECGGNLYFRVLSRENGFGCQLGPWYNYWPLEAHYQTPALPYYPYWPAPQALVPGGTASTYPAPGCPTAMPAAPVPAPAAAAASPAAAPRQGNFRPAVYEQYGYCPYPQAGPWWYGR
jgi:hypothetical protein